MDSVDVFRFKVFHEPSGEYIVPPQWATIKAIEQTQGFPMLETRRIVSSSEVDPQGFLRRI